MENLDKVSKSLTEIATAINGCSLSVAPDSVVHELGRDGLYAIAKAIKDGLGDIADAIREQKSK